MYCFFILGFLFFSCYDYILLQKIILELKEIGDNFRVIFIDVVNVILKYFDGKFLVVEWDEFKFDLSKNFIVYFKMNINK